MGSQQGIEHITRISCLQGTFKMGDTAVLVVQSTLCTRNKEMSMSRFSVAIVLLALVVGGSGMARVCLGPQ